MYFSIALLSPPYSLLTYSVPEYILPDFITKAMRVAIPLGNGALRVGVIIERTNTHNLSSNIEIKNIAWPLEKKPYLSPELMLLAEELSARQGESIARILAQFIPQTLRSTTKIRLRDFKDQGKPIFYSLNQLTKLPAHTQQELFTSFALSSKTDIVMQENNSAHSQLCRLMSDPPWAIRPNAHTQKSVLEFLQNKNDVTLAFLQKNLGTKSLPAINQLIKQGLIAIIPLIEEEEEEKNLNNALLKLQSTLPPSKNSFNFSTQQQEVFSSVLKDQGKSSLHLLYGITGSGKTAVYLELARQILKSNKWVFLLAPEVALALKLKKDVENYLPEAKIFLSHGYQTSKKRGDLSLEISFATQANVIIGTRSALFHSLHFSQNIGLIVLDEEHDASFKQEDKFRYHAKEVAWFRAQQHNAILLLGSATPDIKTFYSAQNKQIKLHTLDHRVGGGALPTIELTQLSPENADTILTPPALKALEICLEKDQQAVILLNRRGYAPILYCTQCHEVQSCPNCSIALTYHKKRELLTCHYCNYSRSFPSPCSYCKSLQFVPLGEGTEKLEEQLSTLLSTFKPPKKVLRLDRDSTRRQGKIEEILAAFSQKEAAVLVGTQMLSKGHHFKDVSLAIIADADLALNFPDYRAAERTFQLLTQSAGRAGRESNEGKVIIQTRDTKHYCWDFIKNQNYPDFYSHELSLRKKRLYPPFTKLALIRIEFPFPFQNLNIHLKELTQILRLKSQQLNLITLGPSPAPISMLNNKKRFQCLVKSDNWKNIRNLYSSIPTSKDYSSSLDLDPMNML